MRFLHCPAVRSLFVLSALAVASAPTTANAWGSDEELPDNAHRRVVRLGAELLHEDIGRYPELREASETIQRHINKLVDGAVAPDYNENTPYYFGIELFCSRHNWDCPAQQLFNDHFYDADSHEGLRLSSVYSYNRNSIIRAFGEVPPEHAESQARRFVGIAIATWQEAQDARRAGKEADVEALFADAVFWLGYASHYFSDIFAPHHAANYPWSPLNQSHSEFEHFVDADLDSLLPNDEGREELAYASTGEVAITSLITEYASFHASRAKDYLGDCVHRRFGAMPASWPTAARDMLRQNRDALSLVYYRFLREVAGRSRPTAYADLPVGQFNVEISMGAGFSPKPRQSRPSEQLQLHVQFKDSSVAWQLDTQNFYRWYSFNTNAQSSYFLDWSADLPRPSQATAICLSRGTRPNAEMWEINGLDIYIHGLRVASQPHPQQLAPGSQICVHPEGGFKFDAPNEAESGSPPDQAEEGQEGGCTIGAARRHPAPGGVLLLAAGLAGLVYGRSRRRCR